MFWGGGETLLAATKLKLSFLSGGCIFHTPAEVQNVVFLCIFHTQTEAKLEDSQRCLLPVIFSLWLLSLASEIIFAFGQPGKKLNFSFGGVGVSAPLPKNNVAEVMK